MCFRREGFVPFSNFSFSRLAWIRCEKRLQARDDCVTDWSQLITMTQSDVSRTDRFRPPRGMSTTVCWMFAASGFSALLYEIVWVRQLGNLLGNTVSSVALVTSTFMLGLGLGSWVFGSALAKNNRFFRCSIGSYGACEIGIGCAALFELLLAPWTEQLVPYLCSYQVGEAGWHFLTPLSAVLRTAVTGALILPATFLMGGTFPLVICVLRKYTLRPLGGSTGVLYGVNTFGAAAACFAADFLLIPQIGLAATQAVAVVMNVGVGIYALMISQRHPEWEPASAGDVPPELVSIRTHGRGINETLCLVLAAGSAVSMAMQVVWCRFITSVVGQTRAVFSLLLGVILIGLWAGSLFGGWLSKERARCAYGLVGAMALLILSTLAGFVMFDRSWTDTPGFQIAFEGFRNHSLGILVEIWFVLRITLLLAAVPALCSGMLLPLASALAVGVPGRSTNLSGLLYLSLCAGGTVGSWAAGFGLIPVVGMKGVVTVASITTALAVVALIVAEARRVATPRRLGVLLAGLAATVSLGCSVWAWNRLPSSYLIQKSFPPSTNPDGLIAVSEDAAGVLAVDEDANTGDRVLITNGHRMSATNPGSQRYMRAFSHLPLLQLDQVERVLVICFGVGNTLHAASLHPSVRELEVVDTSVQILRHRMHFERWNHDVLRDPRVKVFVNDGRHHLRLQPENSYGLITLEPPPISHAGVGSLYSKDFYELVKSRLQDGGFITQWLPVVDLPEDRIQSMVRAFMEVFPNGVLLNGHRGNLILMGRNAPENTLDLRGFMRRLETRPEVLQDLKAIRMSTPTELVGSFLASSANLAWFAKDADPVTDDDPSTEYGFVVFLETHFPKGLASVVDVENWCPTLKAISPEFPNLTHLPAYLRFFAEYHRSFPLESYVRKASPHVMSLDWDQADLQSAIQASPYLQLLLNQAKTP